MGRPTAVSLPGWLIVLGSALVLSAVGITFTHRHDPRIEHSIPAGFNFVEMFAWPAATLALGFAILAGKNWARVCFVLLCVYSFLEGIVLSKDMTAIAGRAVIALAFAFALFGRSANHYFGKSYL